MVVWKLNNRNASKCVQFPFRNYSILNFAWMTVCIAQFVPSSILVLKFLYCKNRFFRAPIINNTRIHRSRSNNLKWYFSIWKSHRLERCSGCWLPFTSFNVLFLFICIHKIVIQLIHCLIDHIVIFSTDKLNWLTVCLAYFELNNLIRMIFYYFVCNISILYL